MRYYCKNVVKRGGKAGKWAMMDKFKGFFITWILGDQIRGGSHVNHTSMKCPGPFALHT